MDNTSLQTGYKIISRAGIDGLVV